MRYLAICLSALCSAILISFPLQAYEIEGQHRFGPDDANRVLRIISTADVDILEPLMTLYLKGQPDVAIDYTLVSSGELMTAIADEGAQFDLALSSAMDLQIKLANDGFSAVHESSATDLVPEWGNWRNHVFAFSQEEASIVVSPQAFAGLPMPRDRQELINILRRHPERFAGRVATYDLRQSGTGYLFATQDARTTETFWRLMEVMGSLDAQLFCCSGVMIEAVSRGDLAVAYNVLGSYARAREDLADSIAVIDPADITSMMLRTAILLKGANEDALARSFIDHLLRSAWGADTVPEYPFYKWHLDRSEAAAATKPIRLGPGLLVFLDAQKRKRFLRAWLAAIKQE
ncbi:ABC transporter substrate-binding protein [Cognatishimia sp. SS12]|uniref:ABC transporter substrate-binding protein n=1 Tax=Cognatishimia sp. SS12 TaxID=2979465 RepID=UPI00232F16DC|nr:ABC transporter substrate-binding protein [Cognatishimia sp. SS12]MDC0736881.1 ABC transporter substrate-binding protein [Cognatishimia sp. SS12]